MRTLVVTGTDTGVGKTVVTAVVARRAADRGESVAVVKPIQTGVRAGEPGDVDEVRRLSGVNDLHEFVRFEEPLAPATAARRAGLPGPSAGVIAGKIRELDDRDLVVVEGAGGILVRFDEDGTSLVDVAALLDAPVLVVVRAGLGTLNHAALTCAVLAARGLECPGLVIGAGPVDPDTASRCNIHDLPHYTGRPVIGVVPEGAARLEPGAFAEGTKAWIEREVPI
jgi:dethiobiotin synthetase